MGPVWQHRFFGFQSNNIRSPTPSPAGKGTGGRGCCVDGMPWQIGQVMVSSPISFEPGRPIRPFPEQWLQLLMIGLIRAITFSPRIIVYTINPGLFFNNMALEFDQ